MQLVIIAGGKGTRLGLKDIPKPMYLLGNKPILEHQIDLAIRHGIKDIIIITGHLSEVIEEYFKDKYQDINLKIVKEPKPSGTAGSLNYIKNYLNDRFMIFYGDLYLDFDINKFIEFDEKYQPVDSIASIIVQQPVCPEQEDLLKIKNDKVVALYPKPRNNELNYDNLLNNAAVYVLSKEIILHIDTLQPQDFGKDIFPRLLRQNRLITAYQTNETLKDLGTIEKIERVKNDYFENAI